VKVGMKCGNSNPYQHGTLQRAAWDQGKVDRVRGVPRRCLHGWSPSAVKPYEYGYTGRAWHRSPSGYIKWHRG